jgi:6-phosphogluconolactonase
VNEATIAVCDDSTAIASRALDLLVEGLASGMDERGVAHLALTGGSSASALFALLRTDARARGVDWSRVHVWQGDERFVPLEHPDRNWAVALREWLEVDGGPGIPRSHQHPIPVDEAIDCGYDPSWAAARYAESLVSTLPRRDGIPAFDVILLGVGSDGHILSTFPGTAAVEEEHVPALAVDAPRHIEPHLPRVTLAPFLLRAAGIIVVMVPGSAKDEVVARCFEAAPDPASLPAQVAVRPNAVWLLEPASARRLRAGRPQGR